MRSLLEFYMPEIKMIYNLNNWPEGHVGHLVPSEEVINAFIDINKTLPIKSVLEFGFNTGWSTYIILKTLGDTTVTSIEIYKFNNAEIAVQRLKNLFPNRTNIVWGDSRDIYKKVISNKIILPNNKYDTAFIDGGHFPEIVEKDSVYKSKLNDIELFKDSVPAMTIDSVGIIDSLKLSPMGGGL